VIVCHCHVVSDREVRRAVLRGASTVREVSRKCRAASGCGGCTLAVREIIESVHGQCAGGPRDAAGERGLSLAAG
jgi:bacterioferritin-associated ferredoxin